MSYILLLRGQRGDGLYPIFDTERVTGLARMTEFATRAAAVDAASELQTPSEAILVYEVQEGGDSLREDAAAVATDMERWFMAGDRPDEFKLREWAVLLRRALGESPNV